MKSASISFLAPPPNHYYVSDMGKGMVKYYGDLLATATRTSANVIFIILVEGDPSRP